jgi:hypothetical protein
MTRTKNGYKFESSNREFEDFGTDIIGLQPDGLITLGYDCYPDFKDEDLTPEEKNEIADYMIKIWTDYKTKKYE